MADRSKLTEPTIIFDTFCTSVDVDAHEEFVRLTGCDEVPVVGYDGPELRIVARMVLPRETARDLAVDLRRQLAKRER
ncbi:hypothetical protein EN930_03740 [Mesorhizobium sp. M7A.F.Ca.CA.004.11.2.1]|nr:MULTISPECIES: hypothetical protein [unclassified Mesorhizobium]MCF6126035.1 hypothetical protein [Mesorhizobium ciceri]MCQ8813930.1 hypothetical protein [Mesorhizobium sp. SEMIA396]RVA31353.1 hypothetical protein EN930_03740 [Mesorhizobium sp. M7A.F.Ca.CA.004.11.2.1]RVA42570.1 hypothetical protein EN928_02590 [Mesorhizobium sp. M7A.F.Ca.CA.004.10.1.1]RVB17116.1 hypothetical protein EN907_06720 [Mesorhizobium sp. M7A.F.Ca.CA.004.06.2.1]RVB43100.1 hypothetical protein EN918_08315 [Mesorhizob